MKNKLLEIEKLSKNYYDLKSEIPAIKDVSFDIYDKEFISVVGPSGCGKSTLLSILANIEEKTNGNIKWNKKNIVIGYMLQSDSLFPWRTILENAMIGLEIKKKVTKENKNYVLNLLKKYGLGEFINKYPDSLSGGMKQRVDCFI